MNILEFQGCIKLINEITIEIHKPWNNDPINHSLIDVKAYIARTTHDHILFIYLDNKYILAPCMM